MKEAIGAREGKWNPREGVLARASIMSSALLIEAAANACLDTLNLPNSYYIDIDRLSILNKFEYFLERTHPNQRLDRGSLPVQKAQELVGIRNRLVHPRSYTTKWIKEDEHTYSAELGETQFLRLPKSFVILKHSDALVALKAAMSFLNHFFKSLCEFSNATVRALLTSDRSILYQRMFLLFITPSGSNGMMNGASRSIFLSTFRWLKTGKHDFKSICESKKPLRRATHTKTHNNPVELTAHSAGFLDCSWRCRLCAAAHRERSVAKGMPSRKMVHGTQEAICMSSPGNG